MHLSPFASQLRARARSQALVCSFRQDEHISVYCSRRLYSSLPPGLTSDTQPTQTDPVFPTSKKPKVELKPGPRPAVSNPNYSSPPPDAPKPASTTHAGASKSAPVGAQPTANSSSTSPKAEGATPPSKIKIAIADIVKAVEAGALAPPPKDAGKIGKLWHQAKELFKFYVRGLKQLLVHRQIVKDLKAREREEKAQGGSSTLTWEEEHFIKTYKEDLVKLIPFLLILLILEEALPLVVLYAPFLLPSTCILPSQRARILWKRDDAQFLAREEARRILSEAGPLDRIPETSMDDIPAELVTNLAKVFGLSTRGPVMLHRRRLEKHLAYLINDDQLLVNESHMGSHLDLRNLRNVMSERGFLASSEEFQLRTTLEKRLKALGDDTRRWRSTSLEFLFKELIESNKDVRPTPVD